ncbi:hypothetical protein D3C87_1154480 [compost metagenome]
MNRSVIDDQLSASPAAQPGSGIAPKPIFPSKAVCKPVILEIARSFTSRAPVPKSKETFEATSTKTVPATVLVAIAPPPPPPPSATHSKAVPLYVKTLPAPQAPAVKPVTGVFANASTPGSVSAAGTEVARSEFFA